MILGVNMHCSVRRGGGGGDAIAACECLKKIIPRPGVGFAKGGAKRYHEEQWDSVPAKGPFREIIGAWDPQTLPDV